MNINEFFVQRWESEQPAFSRVMKAIPGHNLEYRPHQKNSCAGDLAWQLVEEQHALVTMMQTGDALYESRPRPKTVEQIVAEWEKETGELRKLLKNLDDKKAEGPARFIMGGNAVWTTTVSDMLWGFLFDMVHHRGQISTYLRPMGGKVPAIYGPSADSNE